MTPDAVLITDGSADNRSGHGGWCSILRTPTAVRELTGWETGTTSNRMELMAVIEGLRLLKIPSTIHLVADSAYVLNSLKNEWYRGWLMGEQRHRPRPNIDLWRELAGLADFHEIQCVKVKGHSGDFWNDRADKLAGFARKNRARIDKEYPDYEGIWLPLSTITLTTQPLTV